MPIWVWCIVLAGLAYGLVEVGLRERRFRRARARHMRRVAEALGFRSIAGDDHHEIESVLVVLSSLDRPRDVVDLHRGALGGGLGEVQATVFDFVEGPPHERPDERVGFVLEYPTDWPTFELAPSADSRLRAKRPVDRPTEHEFSRALLASALCEYLASQRGWVFGFSGRYAVGASDRGGAEDLRRVLVVAQGLVDRLPDELLTSWCVDPGVVRRPRRRAS